MDNDWKKPIQENANNHAVNIGQSKKLDKPNVDNPNNPKISASYTNSNKVSTITQNIAEERQKLILNESLAVYSQLEINKLVKDTDVLEEKTRKLDMENMSLEKDLEALTLSIDINRDAVKAKRNAISIVKENITKLKVEAEEQEKKEQKVYNDYLEKYKKTRKLFEDNHPLYKQLNKLQTSSLSVEVNLKIKMIELNEMKKRRKLRNQIQNKMFTDSMVRFSKAALDYQKSRGLSQKVKKEEKKRQELLKALHEAKVLAAKKEEELRQGPRPPKEVSTVEATVFATDGARSLQDINRWAAVNYPSSSMANLISVYDSNILLRDKQLQSEKNLEQIRARFEQRQQQWNQQMSVLPPKRPYVPFIQNAAKLPIAKRPKNLPNIPSINNRNMFGSTGKMSIKASDVTKKEASSANIVANQNVNIISVQTLGNVLEMKKANQAKDSTQAVTVPPMQAPSKGAIPKIPSQIKLQDSIVKNNFPFQHTPQQQPQSVNRNIQDFTTQSIASQSQVVNKNAIVPIPKSSITNNATAPFSQTQEFNNITSMTLPQAQSRYSTYLLQTEPPQSQHNPSQDTMTFLPTQIRHSSYSLKNLQSQNKPSQEIISGNSHHTNTNVESNLIIPLRSTQNDNQEPIKMESVELLKKELPKACVAALHKSVNLADGAVISPFFNNAKKPNDKPDANPEQNANDPFRNTQTGMHSYFASLPFPDTSIDSETSMKLDHEFSPVFCMSPTHSNENVDTNNDGAASSGFNFNFGQPEPTQANNSAPFFGANSVSGTFNMF